MKNDKNTKTLIINAILLAIGAILHNFTPVLGLPMQPDFAVTMLIIIVILNKGNYKAVIVSGIITGLFTALSTKFPGGQIPNIVDKIITANFAYVSFYLVSKIKFNIPDEKKDTIIAIFLIPISTFVSGIIFLITANIIVGLPAAFQILISVVVLPAVILNSIFGYALFKIIKLSFKKSKLLC